MSKGTGVARELAFVGIACALACAPWACGIDVLGTRVDKAQDATSDPSTLRDGRASDAPFGLDGSMGDAVVVTDALTDALVDAPTDSATACTAACTNGTCEGGTCHRSCSSATPCSGSNPCAPGVPCKLTCTGSGCGNAINCSGCEVRCQGSQACGNDVTCTGAGCLILCCGGSQACNGNVSCSGVGCGIVCGPGGTCNGNVTCNGGACGDAGRTCN